MIKEVTRVGKTAEFKFILIDTSTPEFTLIEHLEKQNSLRREPASNLIELSGIEFYNCVDFILVTYIQLQSAESILEVDPNGKSTIMIECTSTYDGMFYFGILQGNPKIKGKKNKKLKNELHEKGDEYDRVNFLCVSLTDNRYIGGEGSSDKLVWAKLGLKNPEKNILLINFQGNKPPGKFLLWAQGPFFLKMRPKPILRSDVGQLKFVFVDFMQVNHFQNFIFEDGIIRVGFKILNSGFGFFVLYNQTEKGMKVEVEILNSNSIRMGNFFLIFIKFFSHFFFEKKFNFFF